tara:strand:- start:18271 stop:18441 length:171 start_codon:yes stop_codon:yes gene_type:complete
VKKLYQGLSIGKYCFIVGGGEFLLRGKHDVDWVSTYPFQMMMNYIMLLNDLPPDVR